MKTKSIFNLLVILLISSIMILQYGCKKEDDETPQSNQTGEVIVLEDNSLNNIISYSSNTGTIVFSSVTSEVCLLSKGDILIAGISDNTPYGFLRKVISVSDDKKTVQTEQATLEEAIEEGGLYFEKQLKPDKNFKMDLEKGVKLLESTKDFDFGFELNNFVIYDHDENLSTTNDQILANGLIHFNYTIMDSLCIKKFKLIYFEFMNIVTESSEIEITANFSSNNIDKEKALGAPYQFPTFLAGTIMGIPVFVTPYLEIFIGANGNVSICTSKVSQQTTLSGGVKYANKEWQLIKDNENTFSFDDDPTLNFNLEIKAFAGPRVSLMFYDVAGPYGQVDGYLKLKANNKTIYWYLYGGLDVKVGVKVEALSRTWVDENWVLLEHEEELANGIINGGNSYTDDFSTDTRDNYEIIYRSNNNGVLNYSPNEMIFSVNWWNGLAVKHKQSSKFPDYVKVIMKQSDFGAGTSTDYGQFYMGVSELGNQIPNSWPQLYRMNELLYTVYGNKLIVTQRQDDTSNPNSHGEVILNEEIPGSYVSNQWYTIEFIRENLTVYIYLDSDLEKIVTIPERWLNLDFNIIVGGDTHNGHDAKITHLEYTVN